MHDSPSLDSAARTARTAPLEHVDPAELDTPSSVSADHGSSAAPALEPSRAPASPRRRAERRPEERLERQAKAASVYRVMWRWHFYAGLLVSPILIVTAVTGAIYAFKDEIEDLTQARLLVVAPAGERQPLSKQVAAAAAAFPQGRVENVDLPADPARSTRVMVALPKPKTEALPGESPVEPKPKEKAAAEASYADAKPAPAADDVKATTVKTAAAAPKGMGGSEGVERRAVFVNPYTAEVLGSRGPADNWFFELVLSIHRRLYAGNVGRMVVEFSTSWTIILLLTGVYLWWPRGAKTSWGVWLLRLRAKPYVVLRDLHAVPAALISPVAIVIVFTGLFWTQLWGTGFKYFQGPIPQGAGVSTLVAGGKSGATPETVSLDAVAALGAKAWPGDDLFINLPSKPTGVFQINARPEIGPTFSGRMEVDRYSGAVLKQVEAADLPILTRFRTWVYPLHVGSVFGITTKILAFVASSILAMLTITGVWMWWQRRPAGRTGFPRKPEGTIPLWLWGSLVGCSLFFPAVGLSILVFMLVETLWGVVERRRSGSAPALDPA